MTNPDTLRLVPVEPTEAMLKAVPASYSPSMRAMWPSICGDIYRAMLAAAPASPLPDEAPYSPGVTPDMQVLWDRLKENDRRCAEGLQSLPLDATPEMVEAGRAQKAVDDSPGMIWLVMAQVFLKSAAAPTGDAG